VKCPNCGGAGFVTANVVPSGWVTKTGDGKVFVTAYYLNNEDFGAYGNPTAEVISESHNSYKNSSPRTYFPPHEPIEITITIDGIGQVDYGYFSSTQFLRPIVTVTGLENNICSVCDGTGISDCPNCSNTPINTGNGDPTDVDPFEGLFDGEQRQETSISFPIEWPILGLGVVAAVAVGALVFVKQKKVSESHLKEISSNEFQSWVIKRFSGKMASQRESSMGIDGYTAEGTPILIKQSENVGANVIDSFASVIGRQNVRNGIVVAFSFSDDIYRGIVRAKRNYRIEIKKVSIKDLITRRPL
jgi:hypothetical protein